MVELGHVAEAVIVHDGREASEQRRQRRLGLCKLSSFFQEREKERGGKILPGSINSTVRRDDRNFDIKNDK